MKEAIQKTPRSDELLQIMLTHSADRAEIENTLKLKKCLRTPLCKISSTGEIEQRFRLN